MAQQNKQPANAVDSRMAELEADLIGDELDVDDAEHGQDRVTHPNTYGRTLEIKQGWRRRHPERVLNQFAGVNDTTSTASSKWEESMVHGTKRVELPREFQPEGDADGMSNQLGVVTAALDNYKASQNKLKRMYLVGV